MNDNPLRNEEAEEYVLGAMLVDVKCVPRIANALPVEAFMTTTFQIVYKAILEIYERTQTNDIVSVANHLDQNGELGRIGGAIALHDLQARIVETENVDLHVDIVLDKFTRRQLVAASGVIKESAEKEDTPIKDVLDAAQQSVFSLVQHQSVKGFQSVGPLIFQTIRELGDVAAKQTPHPGLATGYSQLDKLTTGLHPGELAIIAARPGMGKTSFALNVATNVALNPDTNNASAFFSLEMPATQIVLRIISAEACIPFTRLRTSDIKDTEWEYLAQISDRLAKSNDRLFVNDNSRLTVSEMRLTARKLKSEYDNLSLIVLDYMQLMAPDRKHYTNREQEVSEISREIKALAGELGIPIIACSQLNRELEKREDKRPKLADLRESGAIEQDADLVGFLHRDDYYEDGGEDTMQAPSELLIRKQRNGPTGTIRLTFEKEIMRFGDIGL